MKRFINVNLRKFAVIFTLAIVLVAAAQSAKAQFIVTGQDGSLGIRNPNGTYTYIYPQRLQPGANMAVPGSQQMTPWGNTWLGWDGQVHGNFVDPQTGDIHLRSVKTKNTSTTTKAGNNGHKLIYSR
jgi:hypothetical protein